MKISKINSDIRLTAMLKIVLLYSIVIIALSSHATAQEKQNRRIQAENSNVLESLEFKSQIMDTTIKYSIYLPYDYDTSLRHYPVVYLLHGYGNDETSWIQLGAIKELVDSAIEEGKIPPMVIIMPDGGVSYYIDSYDDKTRWQSMFFNEFMGYAEHKYKIREGKRYRAVAGMSMGGFGALSLAMKRTDLFTSCVAFSAAVRNRDDIMAYNKKRAERHQSLFGGSLDSIGRITEHWRKNSPYCLAENLPLDTLNQVNWYLNCGDDDFLINENCRFNILLCKKGVKHEFRVRDGKHNWQYWREGIIDGLVFISKTFQ